MGGDTTTIFRRSNSVLALQGCIATLFWVGTGGEKKCKKVGMLVFRPKYFFSISSPRDGSRSFVGPGSDSRPLLNFFFYQLAVDTGLLPLPARRRFGRTAEEMSSFAKKASLPLWHPAIRRSGQSGADSLFLTDFPFAAPHSSKNFLICFCCFFEEDGRVGGVCC